MNELYVKEGAMPISPIHGNDEHFFIVQFPCLGYIVLYRRYAVIKNSVMSGKSRFSSAPASHLITIMPFMHPVLKNKHPSEQFSFSVRLCISSIEPDSLFEKLPMSIFDCGESASQARFLVLKIGTGNL